MLRLLFVWLLNKKWDKGDDIINQTTTTRLRRQFALVLWLFWVFFSLFLFFFKLLLIVKLLWRVGSPLFHLFLAWVIIIVDEFSRSGQLLLTRGCECCFCVNFRTNVQWHNCTVENIVRRSKYFVVLNKINE